MSPRITKYLLAAVVAAGVFRAGVAHAQNQLEAPLQLTSLEWLVADSDVVVRGVIHSVDAADAGEFRGNWNIVTLDVLETLKGAKAERVQFAVHTFAKADAALAQAQKSKREQLWLLKRQNAGVPGEAPQRENVLARHKIDLHAPYLPGRPGEPALPVISLVPQQAEEGQPIALLTIDLRTLKTSDELVKAIRSAIAEPPGQGPVRSYSLAVPREVAHQTGFSRANNLLTVPVDRRLEEFARRLVESPGAVVGEYKYRLEGIKALRLFPSEKNLAIVRAWLDDPMSDQPLKGERQSLVPAIPKSQQAQKALPQNLVDVPEVHFQQPLTKTMKTEDAQLHTAVTIDGVHLLNQKKTDGYIVALLSKRPDLAGLSFAMGDACRMKGEASRQFVAALNAFRIAEVPPPSSGSTVAQSPTFVEEKSDKSDVVQRYTSLSTEQKIAPSASVASLMQVLGHEDGKTRLGLVEYLDGLANVDATRALAKLAIFSAEPEIRSAAIKSLKIRRDRDYTDILVAGLKYPWPAVAERASEAMVKLGRGDLVRNLIEVLDSPDPRAPQSQEINKKKITVVRELVRINHHHNCLLCHAPAAKEETAKLEGLTAQVPVPSESMVAYYRPSVPDILVRFDVTYLRQDFSTKLAVANADPWPEMQRYDFLVRTREVTDKEVLAYRQLLGPDVQSPYRRAALSALRELTGVDAEPTAAAWRKLTGL